MSRARRLRRTLMPHGRWLLAGGLIALVAFFLRQAAHQRDDWSLRDAVSEPPPMSDAHASLGGGGERSCRLCHVGTLAAATETAVCLSCHDGALASGGLVHGGSHPIGMDYESVRRRDPDRFNDLSGAADVRLDAGRVGCLSCHKIHMRAGDHARQDVIESACESCHRL